MMMRLVLGQVGTCRLALMTVSIGSCGTSVVVADDFVGDECGVGVVVRVAGVAGDGVRVEVGCAGERGRVGGEVEENCFTTQDVRVMRGAMFSSDEVRSCW